MKYVLILLSGGIIDQVTFYENAHSAVLSLSDYARVIMDPDENDAAVFGPDGMIANAKLFMDIDDSGSKKTHRENEIFIIANPCHSLGFLVTSPGEPVGYADPIKALSVLAKMRGQWPDVNLYHAVLVKEPVAFRKDLEKHNADQGIKDFDYDLIDEYLK